MVIRVLMIMTIILTIVIFWTRIPDVSIRGPADHTRTSMLFKSYQSDSVITRGRFARDTPPC